MSLSDEQLEKFWAPIEPVEVRFYTSCHQCGRAEAVFMHRPLNMDWVCTQCLADPTCPLTPAQIAGLRVESCQMRRHINRLAMKLDEASAACDNLAEG